MRTGVQYRLPVPYCAGPELARCEPGFPRKCPQMTKGPCREFSRNSLLGTNTADGMDRRARELPLLLEIQRHDACSSVSDVMPSTVRA